MYDQQRLIELVKQHALRFGDFTLASGKKASYYLDCRKLTLDSEGANVIAQGILEADNAISPIFDGRYQRNDIANYNAKKQRQKNQLKLF